MSAHGVADAVEGVFLQAHMIRKFLIRIILVVMLLLKCLRLLMYHIRLCMTICIIIIIRRLLQHLFLLLRLCPLPLPMLLRLPCFPCMRLLWHLRILRLLLLVRLLLHYAASSPEASAYDASSD